MRENPLSKLDELHASDELKQKTLQSIMSKKSKRHTKEFSFGIIATACICVLFFLYQGNITTPIDEPIEDTRIAYSYVSIDINPSMELILDKENKVLDIKTFNDDAKILLENYVFDDKDAQTVLKEIVSLPQFQAYLEQGYLQVSVFSEDSTASNTIEKALDATLAQVLAQDQYGCTCASKQEKQSADAHHMSFGKYQVINDITNADASYKIEDLQDYSMMELKNIYETLFQKKFQGNSHNQGRGHHGRNHE